MNFISFTVSVSPSERKIFISSQKSSRYRIEVYSSVSGNKVWDSPHEVPSDTSVWISPQKDPGYTDCFVGGCSIKIFSEKGEVLGEHFWKPIFGKKILFVTPHLSTGGCPQYLYRKIVEHTPQIESYVVEWDDIGGDAWIVQKERIRSWVGRERLHTLGEDKTQIFRIIEEIRPDVIHFEEMPETFVPYKILEKIVMGKDRTWFVTETTHSSFSKKDQKVFLPDKFYFVSPFSQREFEGLGVPSEVWEYPIDDLTRPDRRSSLQNLGLDPDFFHVLNVGLFTPGKNQGEIFKLAERFIGENVQFHFLGNQAGNFEHYWRPLMEKKPSNCKVWGERKDVEEFMKCCDVFLFPSTFELNPLVVKEALSWKMPVLMRKLHTYGETYDGVENVHYIDFNISRTEETLREILSSQENV